MTTEYKKGDRVKVTDVLEATITDVHSDGTLITKYGDWIPSDPANISEGWQRTIEKLPDPEPTWVNGDVVKVNFTGGVFVRSAGAWLHADTNMWTRGEVIMERWREGNLTVLHKL